MNSQPILISIVNACIQFSTNPPNLFTQAAWTIWTYLTILRILRLAGYTMKNGIDGWYMAQTIGQIFAVEVLIRYYNSPLLGADTSWPGMIANVGVWIAGQMNTSVIDQATKQIQDMVKSSPPSALLDMKQYLAVMVFKSVLWGIESVMVMVIGFAWLAIGTFRYFGVLFVPFALAEVHNWMWHGWLKSMVGFSMYLPVGTAFCAIFAQCWLTFVAGFNGPMDFTSLIANTGAFIILTVAFIWGIRQVPALASAMFSGQSGLHAMPSIGAWR